MKNPEDPSLKEKLERLIGRVDEIGFQERSLMSQMAQMSQDADYLFKNTGVLREELAALTVQLEQQPVHAMPERVTPSTVIPQEQPMDEEAMMSMNNEEPEKQPMSELSEPQWQAEFAQESDSWELTLGVKWFSRIGIVALLIGLAMGLNYTFPMLTSEVKILLGWLGSIGLFCLGTKLFKKVSLLGRILQGGGLSLGYLSLYAMFFFPSVQLFHADVIGKILLGAYVLLIMFTAQRLRSQAVALLALLFGYYTASYSGYENVAFISTTLLSLASILLGWKHPDWRLIKVASLAGVLGTYFFWGAVPFGSLASYTSGATIAEQVFLALNCGLFYLSSFFQKDQEDLLLCSSSLFGYYTVQKLTPGAWLDEGRLELVLAFINFLMLTGLTLSKKRQLSEALAHTFLISGISFLALATLQILEGQMMSATLAVESLLTGVLSLKSPYRTTLKISSGVLWLFAWITALPSLFVPGPETSLIFTMSGITVVAMLIERWRLVSDNPTMGTYFLLMGLAGQFLGLAFIVPSHWLTVSFFVTGAAFLMMGFLWMLKTYRWIGLGWMAIAFIHLVFVDIAQLETLHKIILFIVLGAGLLGSSYGYSLLERKLAERSEGK